MEKISFDYGLREQHWETTIIIIIVIIIIIIITTAWAHRQSATALVVGAHYQVGIRHHARREE